MKEMKHILTTTVLILLLGILASPAPSHPLGVLHFQTLLTPHTSGLDETEQQHLHLTAVTHDRAPPHHARLQCLNLTGEAFASYPTVGKSVFVSSVSNVTYVVLPPGSAEGWHRPPHPMFFVLLAGLARVETPHTNDAVIVAGRNSLLLALDTLGRGHLTFYPGQTETLALQIPITEDALRDLKLEVVHEGPCV